MNTHTIEARVQTKRETVTARYWMDLTIKQLIKMRARQHAERTAAFCYMAAQSAN